MNETIRAKTDTFVIVFLVVFFSAFAAGLVTWKADEKYVMPVFGFIGSLLGALFMKFQPREGVRKADAEMATETTRTLTEETKSVSPPVEPEKK